MNSNKASTSNILKFFKPNKRAVFFVLLAVLVLGFSANISLAVKAGLEDPPKPGMPVSQLSPAWKTAFDSTWVAQYMWYDTDSQGNKTVPKTAFRYESFLKGVGDYTPEERFQAGQKYKSELGSEAKIDDQRIQQYGTGQASHAGALAGGMKDTATDWLFAPIIAALFVITYFLKYFVGVAGSMLDIMLQPGIYNFTGNPMIQQGWVVVRDICNLFFLLILLFIAICTILKIEKYHAKKTLLMLIIMALLINFSKPIAIFVFDGSQLLMNFFLSQMGNSGTQQASTMYMKASGIAQTLYDSIPAYSKASDNATLAVQYLFAIVFLFMLLVAFLVIAIFFIIRIVVIMMLIIVSPFAFFAAIVPDFSKMSSQWWSALFEYSYYGPAAAFFLLLATKLSDFLPQLTAKTTGTNVEQLIQNSIHYFTTIVFLYASIFMAKKFGGGAGAAVTNWGDKALKGGWFRKGGWPREAFGWGARTTGAADVYKGVKGGIAKQPGWRMLTKEGREARSKESQEKWEERVAPFSMATARKKAKEEEFKDQARVDAGIARGSAHDLLIGSKRGTLTSEQLENSKVKQLIASSPELRKEVLGNLRDKGNSHLAAYLRSLTPEPEDIEKKKTLQDFGKEEIFNNKKLGDMNWEKVISFEHNGEKPFEQILVNRLDNIAQTNAQGFLNIASSLDGTKQDILRDNPKFEAVLKSAQKNARNKNAGSQSDTGSQTGGYPSGGYGP